MIRTALMALFFTYYIIFSARIKLKVTHIFSTFAGSIERSPETSGRPTPSPVPNSVDTGALSVDQIDSILKVIEDSCKKVTWT